MKTWQLLKQNPQLWGRYLIKEQVIRSVRAFFEARDYHELESPILAPALPQEHYLNPLTTNLGLKGSAAKTLYLIPSTERYNKIALAAGLGEHFVITKVFRGVEDVSPNHSPEFTMLEWYHLNANYFDLMADCEELILKIKKDLAKNAGLEFSKNLIYQGTDIDLATPWEKLSVVDALKDYCNIQLEDIQELAKFRETMISKGYSVSEEDDWEMLFELLFANEIEPKLNPQRPTFVYNYPKQLCPLTRLNKDNPLVAEKVELYLASKEIANGYTELLDGREQEKRFQEEAELRKQLGKEPIAFDHELVAALTSGMPEVAGIGMGLDRLIMILSDSANINEINLFPGSELLQEDTK